ncbi:hypothetical protein C8R48DRAFT_723152 [Suillus tomentosus]|nr:hypothetical protein C8R48DRAFT_723152 [Suillus tomentosus]
MSWIRTILAPVCGYAYVRSMSWIHTKLQMHPRTFDELDPHNSGTSSRIRLCTFDKLDPGPTAGPRRSLFFMVSC